MNNFVVFLGLLAVAQAVCPDGWLKPSPDSHRCFVFEERPLSWEDARAACVSVTGELLSIRTQEEKEWIHNQIVNRATGRRSNQVWHWWSGLNARNDEGDWRWSDGATIDGSLIQWQPNEPDQASPDEKCGELHPDGFNDNSCHRTFPYVCAIEEPSRTTQCPSGKRSQNGLCLPESVPRTPQSTEPPSAGPEPVQGACADGWVESPAVPTLCFRFVNEPHTWDGGRELCRLAHGELATMTTLDEKVWLEGQVQRLGHSESSWFGWYNREAHPSWWVGLHRSDDGASWRWAGGPAADASLIKWQRGEPNDNGGHEDCGELNIKGFNDNGCNNYYPFICSRPKDYVPTTSDCPFGQHRVGVACTAYRPASTPFPSSPSPSTIPTGPPPVRGSCPEGWVESMPVSDRCYHLEIEREESWEQARRLCRSARGELLTIRNPAEKRWIEGQVQRKDLSWWIGFIQNSATAEWQWVDRTPATNIRWQPGEPNYNYEKCGELHRKGINNNSCWRKFAFICSRPKDLVEDAVRCPFGSVLAGRLCEPLAPPTMPTPTQGECESGWVSTEVSPNKCFRFVGEKLSFDDAKKMCRAASGDLVTASSVAEQSWLIEQTLQRAEGTGQGEWYVGLQESHNTWAWVDGSTLPRPSQVITKNDNGKCVAVSPDGLLKVHCWNTSPYICQRPLVLPSGVQSCAWGYTWLDGRCQQYELYSYHSHYDYSNTVDMNRVEDELKRLKGRHQQEIAALEDRLEETVGNLTRRIEVLERALHLRNTDSAIFEPDLTLVATHVPQSNGEDAHQVATRLVSEVLGLTDVQVMYAQRMGGSRDRPGRLKILFDTPVNQQRVLHAADRLKSVAGYRHVRFVQPHTRRRT